MVLVVLAILGLLLLPSPWGVVILGGAVAVEVLELLFWKRFLGPEALLGMRADVVRPCSPVGVVRVRGELWNARASSPVESGQTVIVAGVDGLTLHVKPNV